MFVEREDEARLRDVRAVTAIRSIRYHQQKQRQAIFQEMSLPTLFPVQSLASHALGPN